MTILRVSNLNETSEDSIKISENSSGVSIEGEHLLEIPTEVYTLYESNSQFSDLTLFVFHTRSAK